MKYYVAQDTFNAELPEGGNRTVEKGTTLPETDAVVQAIGPGSLFLEQYTGEEEAPAPKTSRARAAKGST